MTTLRNLNTNISDLTEAKMVGAILDNILLFGERYRRANRLDERFDRRYYRIYNKSTQQFSDRFEAVFPCFAMYKDIECYVVNGIPQRPISYFWSTSKKLHRMHFNPDVIFLAKERILLFKEFGNYTAINIDTMRGMYDSEWEYAMSTDNYHIFKSDCKYADVKVLTKDFHQYATFNPQYKIIHPNYFWGDNIIISIDDNRNIYNLTNQRCKFPLEERHNIEMRNDILDIDGKLYIREKEKPDQRIEKNKDLYDSDIGDYMILFADGTKRFVISYILAESCIYFSDMFVNKIGDGDKTIDFTGYKKDIIIDILKYIYYSEKTDSTDLEYLFELYRTVGKFELSKYASYLETKILKMKTDDNIKLMTLLCIKYNTEAILPLI